MPRGVTFESSIHNLDDAPSQPDDDRIGSRSSIHNISSEDSRTRTDSWSRRRSESSDSWGRLRNTFTPPASPLNIRNAIFNDSRPPPPPPPVFPESPGVLSNAREEGKEEEKEQNNHLLLPLDGTTSKYDQQLELPALGTDGLPISQDEADYEEDDQLNSPYSDGNSNSRKTLPLWCLERNTWHIASFTVRHAPCFWFCFDKLEIGSTDRSILHRLNYLSIFFGLVQMASAMFVAITIHGENMADRSEVRTRTESAKWVPSLYALHEFITALGILGFVAVVTMFLTRKVVQQVNLAGSIKFMWSLIWMTPIELFLVIGVFDYHRISAVWIKHNWNTPSLAWYRELFCAPGTSRDQCTVPIGGYPLYGIFPIDGDQEQGETWWCIEKYNQTDCSAIRDSAQEEMEKGAYWFFTLNGIWGCLFLLVLFLTIRLLEGIITRPIVQKSKESNIARWLTLPIVGCIGTGVLLLYLPTSSSVENETNSELFILGMCYLICGSLFFVVAMLGWFISAFSILNARDRRYKYAAVLLFIAILVISAINLCGIFVTSIFFSLKVNDYPIDDEERGTVACSIDNSESCSFCDNKLGLVQCPEWSIGDVITLVKTELKQGATLSAIFFMYSFTALKFGLNLRKHVTSYQVDYV